MYFGAYASDNQNKTNPCFFSVICYLFSISQSEKGTEVQLDCVTARLSPSGVGVGTQKEIHDRKITFSPLVQQKMSLLVYTIVLAPSLHTLGRLNHFRASPQNNSTIRIAAHMTIFCSFCARNGNPEITLFSLTCPCPFPRPLTNSR